MALELQTAEFTIPNRSLHVEWFSADLSAQVSSLPEDIKAPLIAAGVIFSRPDSSELGKIYVTDQMPKEMQGFSALHEHLCQNEANAPCVEVEQTVIGILTPEQRAQYLSLRLPMFVAITMLYPDNPIFAETRDMLASLNE